MVQWYQRRRGFLFGFKNFEGVYQLWQNGLQRAARPR
nr:MAG TPA: hypothetical protein [Caudoviricetes sp.]